MNYLQGASYEFPSGINPTINHPLDCRLAVDTVADLYKASTWLTEDGKCYIYDGMIVSIKSEKETITLENGSEINVPLVYVLQNYGISYNGIIPSGHQLTGDSNDDNWLAPKQTLQGEVVYWRKIMFNQSTLSSVQLLKCKYGWYVPDLVAIGDSSLKTYLGMIAGDTTSQIPPKIYYHLDNSSGYRDNTIQDIQTWDNILVESNIGGVTRFPWQSGYVITRAQEIPVMKYVIKDSFDNTFKTIYVELTDTYIHKPFGFIVSDKESSELVSSTNGNTGYLSFEGDGAVRVTKSKAESAAAVEGGSVRFGLYWQKLRPAPAHIKMRYNLSQLKPSTELAKLANIALFGQPLENYNSNDSFFVLGREFDKNVSSGIYNVDFSDKNKTYPIEQSIGMVEFDNMSCIVRDISIEFSEIPEISYGTNVFECYSEILTRRENTEIISNNKFDIVACITTNDGSNEYKYYSDNFISIGPDDESRSLTWNFKTKGLPSFNYNPIITNSNLHRGQIYDSCQLSFHRLIDLPIEINSDNIVTKTVKILDAIIPVGSMGNNSPNKDKTISEYIRYFFCINGETTQMEMNYNYSGFDDNNHSRNSWNTLYNFITQRHPQLVNQSAYTNQTLLKIIHMPGLKIKAKTNNNSEDYTCSSLWGINMESDDVVVSQTTGLTLNDSAYSSNEQNIRYSLPISFHCKKLTTGEVLIVNNDSQSTVDDVILDLNEIISKIYGIDNSSYDGLWDGTIRQRITGWKANIGVYPNIDAYMQNDLSNGEYYDEQLIFSIPGGEQPGSKLRLYSHYVYDIEILPIVGDDEEVPL